VRPLNFAKNLQKNVRKRLFKTLYVYKKFFLEEGSIVNSKKVCEQALGELAEGNTRALSVIYDEMSRSIFSLAYTLTQNYCDAEDVLQNTMIDITRSCRKYCGGNVTAWIMAIARNNAMDVIRKRKEGTELALSDIPESAEAEARDDFFIVETMDMLNVLDIEEKQIVLMRLYQEMPYREIAAVMGIKIFAAQKKYQRAISKLKKYNTK
jgi:RNA polymerase sigma-70 factor (ECF subfamily)